MGKLIKYDVSLEEFEVLIGDNHYNKDEHNKLTNTILGGTKLRLELENLSKPDIDNSLQICIKSHGIYIQFERDVYKNEKIKEWTFLVRVPIWGGGDISPNEWITLNELTDLYSRDWQNNPSIRLTTRQSIQFHSVEKKNLIPLVRSLIELKRYSLNGCGDNTRNPLACVHKSSIFNSSKLAHKIGLYFMHDELQHLNLFQPIAGSILNNGNRFNYKVNGLPRKFKIAIGGYYIDEDTGRGIRCNCTDILTNDIGIAPIIKNNRVDGFQVYVGGGLGQKNGKLTFAVLAVPLGIFKTEELLIKGLDAIISVQQNIGDRKNRHWARFKNLIIKKGLEITGLKITDLLNSREKFQIVQSAGADFLKRKIRSFNIDVEDPVNLNLGKLNKHLGWQKQYDGNYSYGLWIENGRLTNFTNQGDNKKIVDEIINSFSPDIRITPYQNLFFTNIAKEDKNEFNKFLKNNLFEQKSRLRKNSIACVGLPTCSLAVSDSERYFDPLLSELEEMQLGEIKGVSIGISGCERHCSRNVRNEISIEGKGDGVYQLKLLFGIAEENNIAQDIIYDNQKYLKQIPSKEMSSLIKLLIENYLENKNENEINISEFHNRIEMLGIIDLIKSDLKLSYLLDKTYDPYIV